MDAQCCEIVGQHRAALFALEQIGQRGVRVSTVMSELGGEKIDIIEWSENPIEFIEDALSPARVLSVKIETEPDEEAGVHGHAIVEVAPDQQSLAIGRGGQNVRLAAKLTGWKIDIVSQKGEAMAEADGEEVSVAKPEMEMDSPNTGEVETTDTVTEEPTADRDVNDLDEADEVDTPEEAEEALDESK